MLQSVYSELSRHISERRRQIPVIWQSLSIPIKVLTLIRWTITIPILFAVTIIIFLILVFVILTLFLFTRWCSMVEIYGFNTGDMKVPTFHSTDPDSHEEVVKHSIIFMSVIGVVFGGIHCAGWFFNFPSSDEAILWRVSSAVLTGIPILLCLLMLLFSHVDDALHASECQLQVIAFRIIIVAVLVVYVVSRLLLLVEAFISLRHLTPGMLALVEWTSFIPHI